MIGQWNLKCLGQTFVPLIEDAETIKDVLNSYKDQFEAEYLRLFRAKLGLTAQGGNDAQDNEFIKQTLRFMQANSADFTQFFRKLG
ncbi:protein adenylyltransferase SelO family protein, partial [Acinetobacter baumannii]